MGRKLGIVNDVPAYANAMERNDGRLCWPEVRSVAWCRWLDVPL